MIETNQPEKIKAIRYITALESFLKIIEENSREKIKTIRRKE